MPPTDQFLSTRDPSASANDLAELQFLVASMISRVRTCMPVRVMACTVAGGAGPVGRVDVLPLVQQVDGSGAAWPHATIYNVPYLRQQGGGNAVICDPQAGDIGLIAVCDRDISAVKSSAGEAPPGSRRRHDMSDAVYLHTIIGAAPTQFVRFHAGGIEVLSPHAVHIQAPAVTIDGPTTINGNLSVNGNIDTSGDVNAGGSGAFGSDVTAQGASVHNHVHTVGSSTTSPPI